MIVLFFILILNHHVDSEDICHAINCGPGTCITTQNPTVPYYCQCPNGSNSVLACPTQNPCSENPCGQGTCEVVPHLLHGYLCRCADDTISLTNCNVTRDACSSNPCINGLCIEGLTSFICHCVPTWTGRFCNEKIISPCSNNPCSPGKCFRTDDLSLPYVCLCPNAQFSISCFEYPMTTTTRMIPTTARSPYECNPLDPGNCMNAGRCLPTLDGYRCLCTSSFTGRFCETKTNECIPNPCHRGGSCYNLQSSYICACLDGSFRSQCLLSEVSTSTVRTFLCPCQNGGVCTLIDSQSCMCPNEFTGRFCEQVLPSNSCQQMQCVNGGTCYEDSSSISASGYCLCKNGYTGKLCQIEYFRCRSNGRFTDKYNCAKGKYFECFHYGQDGPNMDGTLLSRSCPTSLRFNVLADRCDYPKDVQCT